MGKLWSIMTTPGPRRFALAAACCTAASVASWGVFTYVIARFDASRSTNITRPLPRDRPQIAETLTKHDQQLDALIETVEWIRIGGSTFFLLIVAYEGVALWLWSRRAPPSPPTHAAGA